jgi:hypothetical protein
VEPTSSPSTGDGRMGDRNRERVLHTDLAKPLISMGNSSARYDLHRSGSVHRCRNLSCNVAKLREESGREIQSEGRAGYDRGHSIDRRRSCDAIVLGRRFGALISSGGGVDRRVAEASRWGGAFGSLALRGSVSSRCGTDRRGISLQGRRRDARWRLSREAIRRSGFSSPGADPIDRTRWGHFTLPLILEQTGRKRWPEFAPC